MARRNRFVQADTVRLDLSDGDWIEVKRELTNGETQQLRRAALPSIRRDGAMVHQEMEVDMIAYHAKRTELYLVDWNLLGPDEKVMPLSRANLDTLDADTADEIREALDRHVEAVAEEKKALSTSNGSSAPPPSSSPFDGPTPTSLTHPLT